MQKAAWQVICVLKLYEQSVMGVIARAFLVQVRGSFKMYRRLSNAFSSGAMHAANGNRKT